MLMPKLLLFLSLLVLTSCQAPVWMYLRNQSNATLSVEMELLPGSKFAYLSTPSKQKEIDLVPLTYYLAYQDKILPIKRRTYRHLKLRLAAEIINEHHLRFYLPPHSTLYLAEPYGAVSFEELRIRYAKVKKDQPFYQYQQVPIHAFKRGGGSSVFQGVGIYYDIE